MNLDKQFEKAQADTKTLTKRPSDTQLLDLYAYFKQGTEGDNNSTKPGMFDIKGKFKWEAWKSKEGLSKEAAKQKYVDLVDSLLETHK
jgi:acyl-CoA-binding protein